MKLCVRIRVPTRNWESEIDSFIYYHDSVRSGHMSLPEAADACAGLLVRSDAY